MDAEARQYIFVVSAVDRDGNRTSQKVSAGSGRDALAAVEAEGYVDAELLSEESMAFGAEAIVNADGVDVDEFFTPEEQLAFGQRSHWGNFVYTTGKLYREHWWVVVLPIALLAWEWYRGLAPGLSSRFIVVLSIILLLLPALLAARSNYFGSTVDFDRMLDALTWGRWQETLRLTPRLRGTVRDLELDAYEAQALAGLGRLPEALAKLEPYRQDADVEEWYLCSKYAEVYETSGDERALLETHLRALRSIPDPPCVVSLDAALAMLRLDQHIDQARQLIDRLRDEPLGEPLGLMVHHVEGLLAYRLGNLQTALARYAQGRGALAAWDHQPMVRAIRDEFLAREAIAFAERGDLERAQILWRQAEPRTRAAGTQRLLREVEAALPAGGPNLSR